MQNMYILTSWLNLHCFQQEGVDYFLSFAHRELGLYYYVINQVISYWLSYRSEVSCIGLRPNAEDLYS